MYSCTLLKSLSSSIPSKNRLASDLWQRLTSLGISRVKPTCRGLRGGSRRKHVPQRSSTMLLNLSEGKLLPSQDCILAAKEICCGERNLHITSPPTLNIQNDTLQGVCKNKGSIPVIVSRNHPRARPSGPQRKRNLVKCSHVVPSQQGKENSVFGPSVLLANTMSLSPKIDEVRSIILMLRPNLGFLLKRG